MLFRRDYLYYSKRSQGTFHRGTGVSNNKTLRRGRQVLNVLNGLSCFPILELCRYCTDEEQRCNQPEMSEIDQPTPVAHDARGCMPVCRATRAALGYTSKAIRKACFPSLNPSKYHINSEVKYYIPVTVPGTVLVSYLHKALEEVHVGVATDQHHGLLEHPTGALLSKAIPTPTHLHRVTDKRPYCIRSTVDLRRHPRHQTL